MDMAAVYMSDSEAIASIVAGVLKTAMETSIDHIVVLQETLEHRIDVSIALAHSASQHG